MIGCATTPSLRRAVTNRRVPHANRPARAPASTRRPRSSAWHRRRLPEVDLDAADAFVWEAQAHELRPVEAVAAVPLELLVGIDRVRDILLANTERFAAGRPANNALLWGARGMGKSSLIKAVHGKINEREARWP